MNEVSSVVGGSLGNAAAQSWAEEPVPGDHEQAGLGSVSALTSDLDVLESEIYRTLASGRAAQVVAAQAAAAGLHRTRIRAELLAEDAVSRAGGAEQALVVQQRLRDEAEQLGLHDLVRRADHYLASTHDRLGHREETVTCAHNAIGPVDVTGDEVADPPAWRAEALMVLALMAMSRPGADLTLVEHAREAVRRHCGPILVSVTDANFAEVAAEAGRGEVAGELADSAVRTLRHHPEAEAVLTWDSISRGLLARGDLEGALRANERALEIEPVLGVADGNGDPWLTAAELWLLRGDPRRGLRMLDAPRRPVPSVHTRHRGLRIRARLNAALGQWRAAYAALQDHLELYERVREVEGDRHVETIQSRAVAAEERERARQFEHLASTDALTGLPNRRAVEQWLDGAASMPDPLLAVAILDVDRFKEVNDEYSHDVGDQVLRQLAAGLVSAADGLAQPRLLARLGGDEFVMLWPTTSASDAASDADRVRRHVELAEVGGDIPGLAVTVSIGVTVVEDVLDLQGTPRPALGRADSALYAAKRAGCNAVRSG